MTESTTPARARAALLLSAIAVVVTLVVTLLGETGRAQATTAPPAVPARTATESAIAKAVFAEFNAERASHGLAPVRMNSALQLSARRHDVTMARYDVLSHRIGSEPVFSTRMTQAGYHWTRAGENIAYNSQMTTAGALTLQRLMYNEKPPNDGHRINILSPAFTDIGVDVLLDAKHHRLWLTTDLGRH